MGNDNEVDAKKDPVGFLKARYAEKLGQRTGRALGDFGKEAAIQSPETRALLDACRIVALEIGKGGTAISSDNVVMHIKDLQKLGTWKGPHVDFDNADKGRPKQWMGSLFSSEKWVKHSRTTSCLPTNHGREIWKWVLRSTVTGVNGTNIRGSAFSVFELARQVQSFNQEQLGSYTLVLGDVGLSDEYLRLLKFDGQEFMGMRVVPSEGAIGALVLPSWEVEQLEKDRVPG